MKELVRPNDKVIAGVCAGIADYLNVKTSLLRVLWVFFSLFLFGSPLLVYLLCWLIIPPASGRTSKKSFLDKSLNKKNIPIVTIVLILTGISPFLFATIGMQFSPCSGGNCIWDTIKLLTFFTLPPTFFLLLIYFVVLVMTRKNS